MTPAIGRRERRWEEPLRRPARQAQLRLATPIYANVGRWLIDGMRNRTVVSDPAPARRYPVTPRGLARAVSEAIGERAERVEALLADTARPDAVAALAALRALGCLMDHR